MFVRGAIHGVTARSRVGQAVPADDQPFSITLGAGPTRAARDCRLDGTSEITSAKQTRLPVSQKERSTAHSRRHTLPNVTQTMPNPAIGIDRIVGCLMGGAIGDGAGSL